MAATADFRHEQRGVALRMAAALCVTVVASVTSLLFGSVAPHPLVERLIVTARADVFVICWLAATIGNVARLRFVSAQDIAGGGSEVATAEVRRANAILQNTLEQVVLAIPIHVALATLVASSIPLVLGLVALFTIGRLLFWSGYAKGAKARALGFAITFYPSVAGLLVTLFTAVRLSL